MDFVEKEGSVLFVSEDGSHLGAAPDRGSGRLESRLVPVRAVHEPTVFIQDFSKGVSATIRAATPSR